MQNEERCKKERKKKKLFPFWKKECFLLYTVNMSADDVRCRVLLLGATLLSLSLSLSLSLLEREDLNNNNMCMLNIIKQFKIKNKNKNNVKETMMWENRV